MWRMRSWPPQHCLSGRGSVSVLPVFGPEIGTERACYRDMSSFPETKAEKYVNKAKGKKFLQYNRLQLSRIYPKGQRLDSSNYDPLPLWICLFRTLLMSGLIRHVSLVTDSFHLASCLCS